MATVILAAGHGRMPNGKWDPGTTWGDLVEHDLNERAMFACYDALHDRGIAVKMERGSTRTPKDRHDGNWARFRADLNSMPAGSVALAVEFHHDWHRARRGGFAIWPKAVGYRATAEQAAATAITAAYLAAGLHVRPSYADTRGLGLLRRPKFPTLIWECDRLGAPMTEPLLAGRAAAAGIAEWLR